MPRRRNVNPRQQHRSPSPSHDEVGTSVVEAHDQVVNDGIGIGASQEDGSIAGPSTSEELAVKLRISPLTVLYCEICSLPPEYCEFGSHITKCKAWLQEAHPHLYDLYYSSDALTAKAGALSLAAAKKLEEDTKRKEAKAEAKADSAAKKRASAKVFIKRIERNKRKHITAIHGLEAFDIDLKKAAKVFAQKFATGASVTKNATGQDEIVVQGDVSDEVEEMLEKGGGVLGKGIGGDSGEGEIVLVEVKGKKGGGD